MRRRAPFPDLGALAIEAIGEVLSVSIDEMVLIIGCNFLPTELLTSSHGPRAAKSSARADLKSIGCTHYPKSSRS
jgi:hypothetical protein